MLFPWRCALLAAALAGAIAVAEPAAARPPSEASAGELEIDGRSEFSHIRIRRRGNIRAMLFVRDAGEEVLETQLDLRRPQVLQFEYLQFMFAGYLLHDQQRNVLIVGLGGGGMIHFLQHMDPQAKIDAVEIDPLVVRLADEFFQVRNEGNVHIAIGDGLKFIEETNKQYDAIYMDAFLKPSAETDGTGAPLNLRTRQFYKTLQTKLTPGGVAAFNLNPHPELEQDIRAIADAFPQAYVFPLARFRGAVVIGATQTKRVDQPELIRRGRELDRRFPTTLNFQEMARRLQR
jgi:spermidine synthase